ncbi:hypothetical protein BKA70DRAFT_43416 [Coprinopsis sp. MPI-PUGE-AT-0042]|nr:hypothetical protein BKA70DRAFT_43416 [Coprinopsis sp. MPI-PUGE-AT-0042]
MLSLPEDTLPCLERLVLVLQDDDDEQAVGFDKAPIRAFEKCSLLQRVALGGEFFEDLPNALLILWKQLTHFFSDDVLADGAYWQCLAEMVNLEYGLFWLGWEMLGNAERPYLDRPRTEKVVLDKLTSLTLNFWDNPNGLVNHPDFWWYFDFPNLQMLRVLGCGCEKAENPSGRYMAAFSAKLQSLKRLERLSLCLDYLDADTCNMFFQSLPDVTYLDLETADDQYDAVLSALLYFEGYLPKLKTLVLEVGHEEGLKRAETCPMGLSWIVAAEILVEMTISRTSREPETSLQRIVFWGSEEWQVNETRPFYRGVAHLKDLVVESRVE